VRGARRALLLAVIPLTLGSAASAQILPYQRVVVVLAEGVSYDDVLADRTLQALARSGGVGLMTETDPPEAVEADIATALEDEAPSVVHATRDEVGDAIRAELDPLGLGSEVLILVVGTVPPRQMQARGEIATPIVFARGPAGDLLEADGRLGGLTSDTTGRPGLVANVDLVPTILDFLGQPIPEDATGNPIRVEGEAPTDLYQTYVEYRRVVTPVGLIVLGLALAALAVGLALVLGPWRPPVTTVRGIAIVGLFAVSLQVGMLAGSWLPDFSWAVVVGTVVGMGALVTVLAMWAGLRSPYAAVAVVGGVGVALVVVDWLLGWRSLLTPLLGGSALEGVRFYGLGNSYAGLLLAGVVLLAAVLRPWAGVALLVAAALFAGVPRAGADLGGGITVFGAAGIWWALRVRGRLGVAELAGVGAAVLGGAVLLVLLHRLVPEPSHVTRAVDEAGGVGGIAGAFIDRLVLNLETTARTPVVWLALAAVPAAIWVAWRRPRPFRQALDAHPGWREAILALGLSAVLGYLLNDTYGLTAVALIYLLLALVYPALDRKNVRSKRKKVVNKQAPRLDSGRQFG
jgi:hypothetical protein